MIWGADVLIAEVRARLGGAPEGEARRALRATMSTLAEALAPVDVHAVMAALPEEVGDLMRAHERPSMLAPAELYARVAWREGISLGAARAHAQAVCGALRLLLPAQARTQLCSQLWPELVHGSRRAWRERGGPSGAGRSQAAALAGEPATDPRREPHPAERMGTTG